MCIYIRNFGNRDPRLSKRKFNPLCGPVWILGNFTDVHDLTSLGKYGRKKPLSVGNKMVNRDEQTT